MNDMTRAIRLEQNRKFNELKDVKKHLKATKSNGTKNSNAYKRQLEDDEARFVKISKASSKCIKDKDGNIVKKPKKCSKRVFYAQKALELGCEL